MLETNVPGTMKQLRTFINQQEENIGCPCKQWQEKFKYLRKRVSKFCQILVTGAAGMELKATGGFVIIILTINTPRSY
jgi:hypothetical protein